ncbi:hypothetical protein TAMA11512_04150 [Selenomonas sp. TAMA-11512]|uniref:hypothetical protein n=1 Tax=Selenomonas sp. TAMA-11512 TaxID=3095337 RepID=UPI0030931C40|nr:hypothetical protein TAMA11512_04150 [Selenomonas sp. TAMA-11512]
MQNTTDVITPEEILYFLRKQIFRTVGLCYIVYGMSPPLDVFGCYFKLYQMDVAHVVFFAIKTDVSGRQQIIYLRSLSELRELADKQDIKFEDMAITMAAYILGFGSYTGFLK